MKQKHEGVVLRAFNHYREGMKISVQGVAVYDKANRLHRIESVDHVAELDPLDIAARMDELKLLTDGWLDGTGEAPGLNTRRLPGLSNASRTCSVNPDTKLLRQVHPGFVQQGQASSQAFRPTPKDRKLLSVYDGDQVSAVEAFDHYTNELEYASAGVVAVTVNECEARELTSRPDPGPFPAHVVIDFTPFGRKPLAW